MFYGNDCDDAPPLPPPPPEGIPLPAPIEESSIPLPLGDPLHAIPLPDLPITDESDNSNDGMPELDIPLPKELAPIPSELPPPKLESQVDGAPITEALVIPLPPNAPEHIESTQPVIVPPPVTEKLSPKLLVNLPKPTVVAGSKLSPSRNSTVSFCFNKKSSSKLPGASVFRLKAAEKAAERKRKLAAQKAKQAEEAEKLPNGKFEVIGGAENSEEANSPGDQDDLQSSPTNHSTNTAKSPRAGEGVPEDADSQGADGGSNSVPMNQGEGQKSDMGGRGDGTSGGTAGGGGAGGAGNSGGDGDKDKEQQEGKQNASAEDAGGVDIGFTKVSFQNFAQRFVT